MNEPYCRCPGCGQCSAHVDATSLKAKLKELKADKKKLLGLVRRLEQWDALDIPNTDGKFWKREIQRVLEQINE